MKNKFIVFIGLLVLWVSLAACVAAPETAPAVTSSDAVPFLPATQTQAPDPSSTPEGALEVAQTPPETQTDQPGAGPIEASPAGGPLPDASRVLWTAVLNGLSQPVFVTGAGDGSDRLFIVQQTGQIMVARAGVLQPEPFLEISDRTTGGSLGERGLLGLAFHPRFAENGYFYVNYTDRSGDTHISRFSVAAENPDRADPASELELLYVMQPYRNHNGGALAFGPDGYLYAGLGDGGSGGDPQGYGQSLQTLLGKILRLDVDGGPPYGIPAGNPFAPGGGLAEIWAYGLRNPWRIAFDALTGDLYIADVGQNIYEEINFQSSGSPGGENYGWNFREASHPYQGTPPESLQLVDPVAEYSHESGCSVTGGVVYRGLNLPDWQGVYLYGDYCTGKIWGLRRNGDGSWENELLFESGFTITSFGADDNGEVYVLNYGQGAVYRLEAR